ncbi:MAG: bifunctional phosphopantothenoylcysteine decarboxylase/phosphopantothenate--cysteine ligase CoaBC [Chloroflexi bacterium]|nr:MAG: bifunctional phosphopantothenoylcysteine decarboxylase/phosphopantothenate--cysteine ligase CoaBC [Chloroflexota bacterium]
MFEGRTVVLGVTGSISAYKTVDLASKLVQRGIKVDVVMTEAATKFVAPLTFQSVTHRQVFTNMFAEVSAFEIEHIALAERADVVAIVPATANTISKLTAGLADNLLTCVVLATQAPVVLAPAMDRGMYANQITQENLDKLRSRGFIVVGPAHGRLASGLEGWGRLAEVEEILAEILKALGRNGDLAGRKVLITAGGTQEPLDPVRYIGNYSSGRMGFALAEAARDRGAKVTLIAAATSLPPPYGVEVIRVQTALQMREAVLQEVPRADALIMAAAVADFRPKTISGGKIKRRLETLTLELVATPDILAEVTVPIKVGFAAESEDLLQNAQRKLKEKGLDLIVANDITAPESGFGADTNKVTLLNGRGEAELPVMPKSEVAHRVLDRVVQLLAEKGR